MSSLAHLYDIVKIVDEQALWNYAAKVGIPLPLSRSIQNSLAVRF